MSTQHDPMPMAAENERQTVEAIWHVKRMSAVAGLVLGLVLLIAATVGYLLIRFDATEAARIRLSATADSAVSSVTVLLHETEATALRRVLQRSTSTRAALLADWPANLLPVDVNGIAWSDDASVPQQTFGVPTEQARAQALERCSATRQPLQGDSLCILGSAPLLLGSSLRLERYNMTLISSIAPGNMQSALSRASRGAVSAEVMLVGTGASGPMLLGRSGKKLSDFDLNLPQAAKLAINGRAGEGIHKASDGRRYLFAWRPHATYRVGVVAVEDMSEVLGSAKRFLYAFLGLSLLSALVLYFALFLLNKARF